MLSAQTSSLYMSHYQARTHNKTTQRSTGHRIHREHVAWCSIRNQPINNEQCQKVWQSLKVKQKGFNSV